MCAAALQRTRYGESGERKANRTCHGAESAKEIERITKKPALRERVSGEIQSPGSKGGNAHNTSFEPDPARGTFLYFREMHNENTATNTG